MNGYKTRIFELHTIPGGMCTSWKRKGYTIDGCFEFLWGADPGSNMHLFWQELGAVQDRQIVYVDEWTRVEWKDGTPYWTTLELLSGLGRAILKS